MSEKTKSCVELNIIDSNNVGNTRYWKVAVGSDVYYVQLSQTKGVNPNGKLFYEIMRKNLIQVDDVILCRMFLR